MDIRGAVSDWMKEVLTPITNFVDHNGFQWISAIIWNAISYTGDTIIVIFRILMAVSCRLTFGIWPKCLNVVPFKVCEKKSYHEDPGVLEMRALLRGEDCFDAFLDQQQRLPFPPPDYDPYDKVYLASYYHGLLRTVRNTHIVLVRHGGVAYQRINSFLFQSIVNYISSRVAVNIE